MAKKYLNAEVTSLDFLIISGRESSTTAGSNQQFLIVFKMVADNG